MCALLGMDSTLSERTFGGRPYHVQPHVRCCTWVGAQLAGADSMLSGLPTGRHVGGAEQVHVGLLFG